MRASRGSPAAIAACIGLLALAPSLPANARAHSSDSARLFTEMAPVLQSPRCMNCHTSTAFPRQGDDHHPHGFNVSRGPENHGAPGLQCSTCHIDRNQDASGVPGAPHWALAPLSMEWEGLTPGQICREIRDTGKNGGRDLTALVAHMTTDKLVQWAWSPGADAHGQPRRPPPVDQARFHELVRRWAASGGRCPG